MDVYLNICAVSCLKLSAITPEILGILKNQEILAINQDPEIGTSISPFRWGINVCGALLPSISYTSNMLSLPNFGHRIFL